MNKFILPSLIFIVFIFIVFTSTVYLNSKPSITGLSIAGYAVLPLTENNWDGDTTISQGIVEINNRAIYSKNKYNQATITFRVKFSDDISKYGSWLLGGFADDNELNLNEKAVFYIDSDFMKAFVSDGSETIWCSPILDYNWQEFHNFKIAVTDKTNFYVDDVEVCSISKVPNKELPIVVNENSIKDGIKILLKSVEITA